MHADAQYARGHLAPGSPMLGPTLALEAMSEYLDDDLDAADAGWAHAFDMALYLGEIPAAALAAAQRAVVAIERQDWSAAQVLSTSALELVETRHLGDYYHAAAVFAVAARTDVHRGDIAQAKTNVTRAARLRPLLTYAIPWSAVFLLQLGHAYLELADPTGARAVLREVRDILRLRPALGTVPRQATELQQQIDTIRQQTVGASAITAAELRIVPLLATHLTFREIGERVHISRHTVKSQAIAIYRKLGVSSRTEAIARVHAIGLLGSSPTDSPPG
jgi:LuxR family maltose regulon positive regulatory protein